MWLVQARSASASPIEVVIFDKARRPGGRASSQPSPRQATWGADLGMISLKPDALNDTRLNDLQLDERARSLVKSQLATWRDEQALIPALGNSDQRLVAPKGLGAFVSSLTDQRSGIERRLSHHVKSIELSARSTPSVQVNQGIRVDQSVREWSVRGTISPSDELFEDSEFDLLIMTPPPPQSASLLKVVAPQLSQRLSQAAPYPQWVARLRGELSWLPESILEVDRALSSVISRVSAEGAKRGEVSIELGELYSVQARAEWSLKHLESSKEEVGALLSEALHDLGHQYAPDARAEFTLERAHRWRFSGVQEALSGGADLDLNLQLGVCGDSYHLGGGVGALFSAAALFIRICDALGVAPDAATQA